MIEPAMMICKDLPGAVAARVVNTLIEIIQTGIETEIETGIETDIGIEKEKGIWSKIEKGTGIGFEIEKGIGIERGTESGIEIGTGREIESGVMIMIGGPNILRGKAEGSMRRAAMMMVGIIIVGVEVGAGAEVGACKLALHRLIVLQVHKEMGARRGHRYLAIWLNLRIYMVI